MSENRNITEKEAHEDWPNAVRSREELDEALEAGLQSGRSELTHDQIIDRAKRRHGLA